jgi:hypothetical protein
MREPYPGYAECCKRWEERRAQINMDEYLAPIRANIAAHRDQKDIIDALKAEVERLTQVILSLSN